MAVASTTVAPSLAQAPVNAEDGNVSYVLPAIAVKLPQYQLIADCLGGEVSVKLKRDAYLPIPNAADKSAANLARYNAYLVRAVFYNVAQRTLAGLVGQIFSREPTHKVPTQLEVVVTDATGDGSTLAQQEKLACELVLSYGRAGIYVDYPALGSDEPVSVAQVEAGDIRPTILIYRPGDIINWRTKVRGAKKVLSLVVLREEYVKDDDGFQAVQAIRYRVLRIDANDQYTVALYYPEDASKATENFLPRDAGGTPMNEIPFTFIGVSSNSPAVDLPPLYDLCSLNLAHYRNSADYEETCYVVGQATPVITGLTQEWYKEVLKEQISFGSTGGIPLPAGADAKLLQAESNSMQKEAMDAKERQMVALGAKLVQQAEVQRTATEADQENMSESSTLSATAKNVGDAFQWALMKAALFAIGTDDGIECELNTEFDLVSLTPEERQQLIAEWVAGALAWEEMRDGLLRAGIATITDAKKAKALIQQEQADTYSFEVEANPANPANPDNPNNPANQPDNPPPGGAAA